MLLPICLHLQPLDDFSNVWSPWRRALEALEQENLEPHRQSMRNVRLPMRIEGSYDAVHADA